MVNKTWMLIFSSIKKSFKQILSIFLLTISVSLILNIFLMITLDYKDNFKRQASSLNASSSLSLFYNLSGTDKLNDIKNELDKNEFITSYEIDNVISGNGLIDYGEGVFSNVITIDSIDNLKNKSIDKCEITYDSLKPSGAYVSYIFDVTLGKKIGDTIDVTIFNNTYTLEIIGFYNSVSTGTINCTDISVYVTKDIFDTYFVPNLAYRVGIILDDEIDKEVEASKILDDILKNVPSLLLLDSNCLDKIETARYTNSSMFEAIMLVACVILGLVLLAIIAIVLTNYIKNSVRNFGTLKALGYSSNELIYPLVVEFGLISLIGSLIGASLSYTILPIVNSTLERQVGLLYEIHFILLPFIISVLTCVILCIGVTYISIRKIKNIAPINAIRENKAKNSKIGSVFNFDKVKTNVNITIGANNLISGISRTIIILFSFIAVSFLLGFSAFLYQNVIVDESHTVSLVCGQVCDSIITVFPSEVENLKAELDNDDRVKNYYLYTTETLYPENLDKIMAYIIDKDNHSINKDIICIEGDMPYNDNEIAVNGAYANKFNLNINDYMSFKKDDTIISYKIVGITQGAYHSGIEMYITQDGYLNLSTPEFYTYYVDTINKDIVNTFNSDISNKCNVFFILNQNAYLDSIVPLYCLVLNILGIVIITLCIIISFFVLYIILSIMLENKKREHGILKSIGYTSKDILIQTLISTLPACIIGTFIGLLISKSGSGALITSPLKIIGIFSFGASTNTIYLVVVGVALLIFTYLMIIFLSRSIKKITPHQLFNRE